MGAPDSCIRVAALATSGSALPVSLGDRVSNTVRPTAPTAPPTPSAVCRNLPGPVGGGAPVGPAGGAVAPVVVGAAGTTACSSGGNKASPTFLPVTTSGGSLFNRSLAMSMLLGPPSGAGPAAAPAPPAACSVPGAP